MSCILFSSTRVTASFRHVSARICLLRNLHEEMPQIDHSYDGMQIYRAALLMTVGRRSACFHRWCECGVLGSITADDDNSDEPLKSNANLERSMVRVLIREEVMLIGHVNKGCWTSAHGLRKFEASTAVQASLQYKVRFHVQVYM